jgi:hypothetical protein
MTALLRRGFAISPRVLREFFAINIPLSEIRGRRESRVPNAPAASRAK